MLIGSKDSFAIEFEVDPISDDATELDIAYMKYYVYGRLCFWVNHQQIGEYDEGGSLSVGASTFSWLVSYQKRRYAPALCAKSAEEIFHTINDALYVDRGQSDEQVQRDKETYQGFLAIPVGFDIFDEWMGFLVNGDQVARYVWWHHDEEFVHEATLKVGEFETRLQEFVDWFNANHPPVPYPPASYEA